MSEINDLRERVEAAEQRFGLMDEQQRHYSERLIGLIETIEAQLADARGEIEKQIAENQRLAQENEELRTMLHSVLRSIEEKTFTQTLQNLEARVSALVSHAGTGGAPAQAAVEPAIDAVVEADDNDPEAAESEAAEALIIEDDVAADAPDGEAQPDRETAFEDDSGDVEATADASVEMPETVAFEDADPEEIAAEVEAEGAGEAPQALAAAEQEAEAGEADATEPETPEPEIQWPETQEPETQEPETQEDDAPEVAAIADEEEATFTEAPSEDQVPAAAEANGDPAAAEGIEGEDIFAAMNLLNADDEDFAKAAQDAAPIDDDVSVHDAAAAEGDIAAPGIEADTTAEADAAEGEDGLSDAVAERLAGEVPEELAESVAPTVKEIIRRVGDLARELERAEASRRSARGDEHNAEAAVTTQTAMADTGDDIHSDLDQAANA